MQSGSWLVTHHTPKLIFILSYVFRYIYINEIYVCVEVMGGLVLAPFSVVKLKKLVKKFHSYVCAPCRPAKSSESD